MTMPAAAAKRPSLSSRGLPILAAAGGAAGCLASFRPLGEAAFVHHSPHHASLALTHHHRHRPSALSRQRSWALGGYSQVGDYFASFGSESGDGGSPEDHDDGGEKREGKYMGHGRIDGDGAEGGVFDINNYFGSFGSDDDDGHVDDGQDAPQQSIPAATEENRRQPMREMTYEEIVQHNNARLCPKMLLTQRAVQSFIYLLEECRDPHSGKWLEDFLGLENLGNYHGTGAFNVTRHPTWDAVLYDIMRQPNDAMIVSAKRRGRGHGGWSKDNPYLEERWVEFKIDIRPATLVQRLLPVRAQIAEEFRRDLDVVTTIDARLMESYFRNVRAEEKVSASSTAATFDRIAAEALTNSTEAQEFESSPFRRGNFDLLYGLCTQAAAHRFLREQRSVAHPVGSDATFPWFKQFYAENAPDFFDGDRGFGRADDFVDALLRTPPSLVETEDGRTVGLTDPLRIAERIISLRSEIAEEWKGLMRETPDDHARLNDVLFRVMMGRTIDESGNDAVAIREEATLGELSDSAGEFE